MVDVKAGARRDIGIALGGHVESLAPRAFNQFDELRSFLQPDAGDVHNVKRCAGPLTVLMFGYFDKA